MVCSNLSVGEGRHYWLVEVKDGRMQQAYDSLQGVQPLTQEVYKMLQVTGVLLRAAGCSKPTLRNPKLDQIAGKVETVRRRRQTIRVASRSRTYKLRKQLVKSMSSLTVAPAKLSFVPEYAEKGTTSCNGTGSLRRLAVRQHTPVGVAQGYKTQQARKVKGGIKNRARSRNTSKALPFCNTTAKRNDLCGGSSSVDVARKDRSFVRQGRAAPSEVAGDNTPRHRDVPDCNTRAGQDTGEIALASDPISETFSQPHVLPISPSKEKKRSYAQAELEQGSPNHEVTEDELRRNQGPPKAETKANSGGELKGATESEFESELNSVGRMCQSNQGKDKLDGGTLTLIPDANMPEPPVENPAEDLSKVTTKCHPSAPRTARCRAQPAAAGGDGNQGVQCEDLVTDAPTKGRYGVISLFDGVSTVMPILKNGRVPFGKVCKLGANKLPHLRWEQVIPPPFLKAWFKFLQVCESRCVRGKDISGCDPLPSLAALPLQVLQHPLPDFD